MAGQFCFCGDVGRGIDAGVCEDAGGGLLGGVGGVLFVVDGDAGEQGAVEDASFGWFALVVEVVEVDQEFGELVQACSGLGVGVGEWGVTLLVDSRYQEGSTGVDVYESQEVHPGVQS